MGLTRNISIFVAASAMAVFVWFSQPGAAVEPPAATRVAAAVANVANAATGQIADEANAVFRGVGSCAASNCHGGDPDSGIVGAEYSVWVQEDKHAEAYSVLLNDESKLMAELLGLEEGAHNAAICLNCHSPQRYEPIAKGEKQLPSLLDGVGCESCHGGAEKWLAAHVRWTDETPVEEKTAVEFVDTDDLWARAKMCADCHVGAPGRDVNHDLYAAGHPRLFFELSAFMANMPIHWDIDSSRARADWSERPGMEASTWALGQLATAEATVDLLVYRAERSAEQASFKYNGEYPAGQVPPVWPEYAETGCFACHHNLTSPAWRQQRGYASRKPGQYPWGTWAFPLTGVVTKKLLNQDIDAPGHSLSELQSLMAWPSPPADKVVVHGKKLQQFLNAAAKQFPRVDSGSRKEVRLSLEQIAALRSAVTASGPRVIQQNWDGATQVYLALTALQRGHRDLRALKVSDPNDPILKALMGVRGSLEFPSQLDSPRHYSSAPIKTLDEALNTIRTSLD